MPAAGHLTTDIYNIITKKQNVANATEKIFFIIIIENIKKKLKNNLVSLYLVKKQVL